MDVSRKNVGNVDWCGLRNRLCHGLDDSKCAEPFRPSGLGLLVVQDTVAKFLHLQIVASRSFLEIFPPWLPSALPVQSVRSRNASG